MLFRRAILASSLVWLITNAPAIAQQAPPGWKFERNGPVLSFTPQDLQAGEHYQVAIFPHVKLSQGQQITNLAATFADNDLPTIGQLSGKQYDAQSSTPNVASVARTYKSSDAAGELRLALYFAITIDQEQVRMMRLTTTMRPEVANRYKAYTAKFVEGLTIAEKNAAVQSGRGVNIEWIPEPPTGMKAGGPIVAGIYEGNGVNPENDIITRFRLYLYENGEYRLLAKTGGELEAETYRYSPITGKLDLSVSRNLYNSNPKYSKDNFCLFVKDQAGKPVVYAESYRLTTTLRYTGPIDRPSPQQEKQTKAALEAERRRYKFVTPPGQGVQATQIEGIWHFVEFKMDPILGNRQNDEVYLLLKDGSIRDGIPVVPDELDAPLSKRREPAVWGQWKRNGAQILVAWPDRPNHFEPLKGRMAVPGKKGERIAGRFGSSSTTGNMITGGSVHFWGVTFAPDGRFTRDSRGQFSSGSLAQTMNDFVSTTTYDDEGAVSSTSAPGVVATSTRKQPKGSHKSGTYEIDGYTITLKRDDGVSERQVFFFENPNKDSLFMDGASLARDKK